MKCKLKSEAVDDMLTIPNDQTQYFAFSNNIKSGYHHIDIFLDDQQFLGFLWNFNGVWQHFKVKYWQTATNKIIVYLDDGMGVLQSFNILAWIKHTYKVRSNIKSSRFMPNDKKLIGLPHSVFGSWIVFAKIRKILPP